MVTPLSSVRIGLATTTRELTARHRDHATFRGILTEIIAHDREEFSSPIDRGQLNGDPGPRLTPAPACSALLITTIFVTI